MGKSAANKKCISLTAVDDFFDAGCHGSSHEAKETEYDEPGKYASRKVGQRYKYCIPTNTCTCMIEGGRSIYSPTLSTLP